MEGQPGDVVNIYHTLPKGRQIMTAHVHRFRNFHSNRRMKLKGRV